jgi:hypothetical protein
VALIEVRFAVLSALQREWLDRARASAILAAARQLYFSERQWPAIFQHAGVRPGAELRELCERTAIKRRDAELAVRRLAEAPVTAAPPTAAAAEIHLQRRYPGHDPLLGHTREELEPVLWEWLHTTGRARRYPQLVSTPAATWNALAAARELEHELMRWYAVQRVRQ